MNRFAIIAPAPLGVISGLGSRILRGRFWRRSGLVIAAMVVIASLASARTDAHPIADNPDAQEDRPGDLSLDIGAADAGVPDDLSTGQPEISLGLSGDALLSGRQFLIFDFGLSAGQYLDDQRTRTFDTTQQFLDLYNGFNGTDITGTTSLRNSPLLRSTRRAPQTASSRRAAALMSIYDIDDPTLRAAVRSIARPMVDQEGRIEFSPLGLKDFDLFEQLTGDGEPNTSGQSWRQPVAADRQAQSDARDPDTSADQNYAAMFRFIDLAVTLMNIASQPLAIAFGIILLLFWAVYRMLKFVKRPKRSHRYRMHRPRTAPVQIRKRRRKHSHRRRRTRFHVHPSSQNRYRRRRSRSH